MIGEFRRIGDMMFLSGLVDASSGNMSYRTKDGVWITKTGKSLYGLRGKDLVKIEFERDIRWNAASSETPIHINIYKNIEDAKAIIHAHCPFSVALSFKQSKIKPIDYEGSVFLKETDVIDIPFDSWDSAKNLIPQYFKDNRDKNIVIAKGHGVFAYSDTLFGAYQTVSALESASKIITLGGFYE